MNIEILATNHPKENSPSETSLLLKAEFVEKSFTLHNQGGVKLSVLKIFLLA